MENRTSLDVAYDFVIPAYDTMLSRLNSVEQRIDGLMGLVVTATIAVPIAVGALNRETFMLTASWYNYLGLAALALALFCLVGLVYVRQMGKISYTSPKAFNNNLLASSPQDLKQIIFDDAAEFIEDNSTLVKKRSAFASILMGLFAIALSLGLIWGGMNLAS